MLHFFRKIRHDLIANNKSFKYFKYAIGEIVLVVIGILIALSINNWNEEKKSDEKTKILFAEVQKELLHNIKRTNYVIDFYLEKDSIAYKVIKKKADAEDYKKDHGLYKSLVYGYYRVVVEDDAFQNLLNSESSFTKKQDSFISDLKNLYGVDKLEVENYDNYTMSLVRDFTDKLRNEKHWFSDFMSGKVSDEMLQYFLNDPFYLNQVYSYVWTGYDLHLNTVLGFRLKAISLYEEVSDYIDLDKGSTIIINFKNINHLTGTYEPEKNSVSSYDWDEKIIISEKDHELILNYYEDNVSKLEYRMYPYLNNCFIVPYNLMGEDQGILNMFLYDENNELYGFNLIGEYGRSEEKRPKWIKID